MSQTTRLPVSRRHRFPADHIDAPWHFLNFLPEPHGHGSLRPTDVQSTGPAAPPFVAFSMSVMLRALPAPTITGSFLVATYFSVGVSAGPASITSFGPVPLPSNSATTSSRTPIAL